LRTRCCSWPRAGTAASRTTAAGTAGRAQPWNGNDMDTYADDLAALVEGARPEGRGPRRPLHRRRRGRSLYRPARYKARRQGGPDRRGPTADAEDGLPTPADCRSKCSTRFAPASRRPLAVLQGPVSAVLRRNRPGSKVSQGLRDSFWLQGMMAGHKAVIRLHQGLLRDGLHRGPEEDRRADAHPSRRRRPDRTNRRLGSALGQAGEGRHAEGLSPARRTACARPSRT
jgi:hypothetical protein